MNDFIWKKEAHITSKFKGKLQLQADNIIIFVFSFKVNLNIRGEFNEKFWIELLDNHYWFFRNFAPELLLGKKKNLDRICAENDIVFVEQRNW